MGNSGHGGNYMGLRMMRTDVFIFFKRMKDILWYEIPFRIQADRWAEQKISATYKRIFGSEPDLEHPETLNEKLQWLKLHERSAFYTRCVDKYAARDIWRTYGEEGLVPLLMRTRDVRRLNADELPEEPFIVKCNAGYGCNIIVRDKRLLNYKKLQCECKKWLVRNYFYQSQEYAHRRVKPCILVEKLLLDKNGTIPNDYKLHFFNGKLEFIYCSVDREGADYRCIYSPDWKRMDMEWVVKSRHKGGLYGPDIKPPASLPQMIRTGRRLSRKFSYVRLDFYDVDGKMYYGEITLYHGSGYDSFRPEQMDLYYGKKLMLPEHVS